MKYRNIVILTGAGISAESGLGTFRGSGGLWEDHRVEDVATPEAFQRDPGLVHRFYNARRRNLGKVKPNAAHIALARLQTGHPGSVILITQNVDDLHERAGSGTLLHMHGELLRARCRACADVFDWPEDMDDGTPCPSCAAMPALRPHIVWFGEMPFHMEEIDAALLETDLFISIGTSGSVYPAAGYVAQIHALGRAHSVELNLEPSEGQSLFAERRYGPATEVVPDYVEEILGGAA
ncbi:MAG: NAD-dependent protein deacylase [Proteobacteria bacterium]|nr:NAD-dependent protein deacylase [Pseudomonadota bacterium]